MNPRQAIGSSQVVSFPRENESPSRDPKRAAEIAELQLALQVAMEALDVLEARVPNRNASSQPPATSGPAINRFASRIAEGLSRARAAG
jgi:hypothetical protein